MSVCKAAGVGSARTHLRLVAATIIPRRRLKRIHLTQQQPGDGPLRRDLFFFPDSQCVTDFALSFWVFNIHDEELWRWT